MRLCFGIVMLLITLSACDPDVNRTDNNAPVSGVPISTDSDSARFAAVKENVRQLLKPLTIPSRIAFDSIPEMKIPVKAEDATVLFPKDFGIPSEVSVFAFATHPIDSVTDGIWFYMELLTDDGSLNKDIWLVLYNKTSGPTAAHCFATSGEGYAHARVDSPKSFREVSWAEMENINVTTGAVTIVKGGFVEDSEVHKTFGSDQTSYDAAIKYVDEFFK